MNFYGQNYEVNEAKNSNARSKKISFQCKLNQLNLIKGTLNVLKAAFLAKVSRVVLTSSTASIYTFSSKNTTFTEADWTDPVSKFF